MSSCSRQGPGERLERIAPDQPPRPVEAVVEGTGAVHVEGLPRAVGTEEPGIVGPFLGRELQRLAHTPDPRPDLRRPATDGDSSPAG